MTAREIKWIQQPKNCCGQTCIAMLAGITVFDAIALFGHRGFTSTKEIKEALETLSYTVPSSKLIRLKQDQHLPMTCILKVCWYEDDTHRKRTSRSHWVLRYEGKCYDPSDDPFILPPNGKITSYLPFYEADESE